MLVIPLIVFAIYALWLMVICHIVFVGKLLIFVCCFLEGMIK
jgi:hypothetical protein